MTTFQNALVTGASSGIGRALAERLAARGTRVVLAARREAELVELAEAIARAGGRADVQVLDVADADSARDAVLRWDRDTGGLDLVLANAGVGILKPAHKLQHEDVVRTLQVNVIGACATLAAAIGPMVARGRGTLAGMSSIAGRRGLPMSAAYSASKAALSTFLESLAIDLARRGVRVVDLRPGFARTEMTAEARFPMPFMMDADRVAERCLRALERGKAVSTFPFPLAAAMGLGVLLPGGLYRFVMRRTPLVR